MSFIKEEGSVFHKGGRQCLSVTKELLSQNEKCRRPTVAHYSSIKDADSSVERGSTQPSIEALGCLRLLRGLLSICRSAGPGQFNDRCTSLHCHFLIFTCLFIVDCFSPYKESHGSTLFRCYLKVTKPSVARGVGTVRSFVLKPIYSF